MQQKWFASLVNSVCYTVIHYKPRFSTSNFGLSLHTGYVFAESQSIERSFIE